MYVRRTYADVLYFSERVTSSLAGDGQPQTPRRLYITFIRLRQLDSVLIRGEVTIVAMHTKTAKTSSFAVAERPRDALCPSAVSFNGVILERSLVLLLRGLHCV